ncbi:MAG: tetratricopeptide repeat protein [Alphaproteobacteria bacterium]|nr:tetratricopeptide repeat protein [Alphaproteobacteria bacterium]
MNLVRNRLLSTSPHRLARIALCAALGMAVTACQSAGRYGQSEPEGPKADPALIARTMAEAAERSGDKATAAQYYSQAIADGKCDPHCYVSRGELLLELGAPEAAAEGYRQALQAGVDLAAIHRGYGRALNWLGQPAEALAQYDKALAQSPEDVKAMNGRGVALDGLDRHEEAQAQYKAALAAAPGNLAVENNLALSYALSGRVDKGISILERIQATGTASKQHRQNLALLYGLTGQTEKAAALARQDLSPSDVEKNLSIYATMHHLYDDKEQPAASAEASKAPKAVSETSAAPEAAASGSAGSAAPAPAAGRVDANAQPWVVDLGVFSTAQEAADAWQRLKRLDEAQLGELVHYVEPDGEGRRLIAGPVWGEATARQICSTIGGSAPCAARPAAAGPADEGQEPTAGAARPAG